ncbi:MAG: proton-conducting transporter membrane subunit [Pirellulaceae bacterium]
MLPFFWALAITVILLWSLILIPSHYANKNSKTLRYVVTYVVGLAFCLACTLLCGIIISGKKSTTISLFEFENEIGANVEFFLEGVACLMLVLVSFIGFIVCQFSIRYLDGESMQGRYFRWIGFTIGAVSMMTMSANLLLFFVAWIATSLGLHQLLLHYRYREAAHRAAWTKFTISRIGDAFLVFAIILTFRVFGTVEFSALFASANEIASSSQTGLEHMAIGWFLVMGAITKSAQFPFHTWLPDTMETPTPVSALMHAGVVNAGGYLLIRMSPLVTLSPNALTFLTVVGTLTAVFASTVMMTQSSIKRTLAYSTIAQMGFMMLQCGLGAFSAAMLHIIAHSLYKSHAFLNSGNLLTQTTATPPRYWRLRASPGTKQTPLRPKSVFGFFLIALALVVLLFLGTANILRLDHSSTAGGLILMLIFCLSFSTWGYRFVCSGNKQAILLGVVSLGALFVTYFSSYLLVNHLIDSTHAIELNSRTAPFLFVGIGIAFSFLLVLNVLISQSAPPRWLNRMRVHAANGFYIETLYSRLFLNADSY